MTDERLDPQRQKLIGALYGELSPEEERDLQAMLAENDELRSDWEDLQGARAFLKHGDAQDKAPSFVFLSPPEPARKRRAAPVGLRERLRAFVLSPAGAFAAVAAGLVILIASGFRVDRVDNGLAFRMGSSEPPAQVASPDPMAARDFAQGLPSAESYQPVEMRGMEGSEGFAPPYLTRAELTSQRDDLLAMMSIMLKSYEEKRNDELGFILNRLYEDVMGQQQREYSQLRSEIERVGLGFGFDGNGEPLIKKGERYELTPVSQTTENE